MSFPCPAPSHFGEGHNTRVQALAHLRPPSWLPAATHSVCPSRPLPLASGLLVLLVCPPLFSLCCSLCCLLINLLAPAQCSKSSKHPQENYVSIDYYNVAEVFASVCYQKAPAPCFYHQSSGTTSRMVLAATHMGLPLKTDQAIFGLQNYFYLYADL